MLGKILGIPGIHGHIFGRDGSTIQDSIGCIGKTIIGHSPFKAIGLPPAAGGGGKSQAHGSPDFGNAGTYFVGKIPRQGIAAPGDQGIHLIIYAVIYHAAPYGGTLGLAGSNGSVYATSYQRIRIRHRVRDTATIRNRVIGKLCLQDVVDIGHRDRGRPCITGAALGIPGGGQSHAQACRNHSPAALCLIGDGRGTDDLAVADGGNGIRVQRRPANGTCDTYVRAVLVVAAQLSRVECNSRRTGPGPGKARILGRQGSFPVTSVQADICPINNGMGGSVQKVQGHAACPGDADLGQFLVSRGVLGHVIGLEFLVLFDVSSLSYGFRHNLIDFVIGAAPDVGHFVFRVHQFGRELGDATGLIIVRGCGDATGYSHGIDGAIQLGVGLQTACIYGGLAHLYNAVHFHIVQGQRGPYPRGCTKAEGAGNIHKIGGVVAGDIHGTSGFERSIPRNVHFGRIISHNIGNHALDAAIAAHAGPRGQIHMGGGAVSIHGQGISRKCRAFCYGDFSIAVSLKEGHHATHGILVAGLQAQVAVQGGIGTFQPGLDGCCARTFDIRMHIVYFISDRPHNHAWMASVPTDP